MKKKLVFIIAIFVCTNVLAQKNAYVDSIKTFQKNYIATHEVVAKKDRKYFNFFPINSKYNLNCSFEKVTDKVGFDMTTSAKTKKHYYKYGRLGFEIDGNNYHLFVYQSKDLMQTEKYRNYLFVPFTDATSGDESYGSGRYLEFFIDDIHSNRLQLDFNKAYNPYCAYSPNYKCPIPPRENFLSIAIKAGEMNFCSK